MKLTLKDMLQYSFVISINDKQYDIFKQRFEQAGLNDPLPRLVKGAQYRNDIYKNAGFIKTSNIINCTISHDAIVRMAQTLDWPFVCVFEDDALPSIDAKQELERILQNIPDECDCLRLGYMTVKVGKQYDEIFSTFNHLWGSHAQIIFKKYYDDYFKYMYKYPVADEDPLHGGKDNLMLMTNKCLFIQNNNFTDNALHKDRPNKRSAKQIKHENRFNI